MIENAEIIRQPCSGAYEERVYDNPSPWNSQDWTWVKFTNKDYTEWVGNFRGFPKEVGISRVDNIILVLTSDYLFQIDRKNGKLIKFEEQPSYINITKIPKGGFLVSDYYEIEKIESDINEKRKIESPVMMDSIKFCSWSGDLLEFTCDEFTNWGRHLVMQYDDENEKITIKSSILEPEKRISFFDKIASFFKRVSQENY